MEMRIQGLESQRKNDKETLDCIQEQCVDNRQSIEFLHDSIKDAVSKSGMIEVNFGKMISTMNTNHSNLVETMQKLSKEQKTNEQTLKNYRVLPMVWSKH